MKTSIPSEVDDLTQAYIAIATVREDIRKAERATLFGEPAFSAFWERVDHYLGLAFSNLCMSVYLISRITEQNIELPPESDSEPPHGT